MSSEHSHNERSETTGELKLALEKGFFIYRNGPV